MTEGLISVIIPIYNREQYLKRCLDSVVGQTYRNLEILLIDDGSTDRSAEICSRYAAKDGRIRLLRQANGGVARARNLGLKQAGGEYLAFVDSDDWLDCQAYEVLLQNLKAADADVSVGSYIREYHESRTEKLEISSFNHCQEFEGKEAILRQLTDAAGFFNCFIWNKLYRRRLVGTTSFREEARMSEDYFFNWNVLKNAKKAVFSEYPVYHYRNYNESLTRKCPIENFFSAIGMSRIMLSESAQIDETVRKNILNDYLGLNLRAAELMLHGNFNAGQYRQLRENIQEQRAGIAAFKLYRRILCRGFLHSFRLYELIYYLQLPLIKLARIIKERRVKRRYTSKQLSK